MAFYICITTDYNVKNKESKLEIGIDIGGLDANPNELDKPSLKVTINDIKLYNYYTVVGRGSSPIGEFYGKYF